MNTTDVQGTLREMWETRPARPRQDRQVAGVAAAIARRYDIDPTLVRVGFVVAAFSGIGAALYIAGWVAAARGAGRPGEPGAAPLAADDHRRSGSVIAAAFSIGSMFGGDVRGGILLATLVVAGLLFLLHRSRSDRGRAAPRHRGCTVAAAADRRPGCRWSRTLHGRPASGTPSQPASAAGLGPAGRRAVRLGPARAVDRHRRRRAAPAARSPR